MIMGDRGTGKSTTVRALVYYLQWKSLLMILLIRNPSDPELMSEDVRRFNQVKH
jgi:Mg-chelatase subunit ChlI